MQRKKNRTRFLAALGAPALLLLAAGAPGRAAEPSPTPAAMNELTSLFPDKVPGYAPAGKDGVYDADNLFDLIDGGAEVYRSFHVRRVGSRRYAAADAPDILADLFDMGSSKDAFGAYHHDIRDGKDAGMGAESEVAGSSLCFWKDRYFVSLVALADTPETRRALAVLGREIAGRIPETGEKPGIVGLLPAEGLERDRLAYFHDWTYLNTRHFIAEENLLLLDGETEGILARYRGPAGGGGKDPRARLLLLARYPSAERARQAAAKFRAGHLPEAGAGGVGQRQDGTWSGVRSEEDLVVVVMEAAEKPDMDSLVAGVRKARAR